MDIENNIKESQAYEARGVVARIEKIGEVQIGLIMTPIYKYITLDCGKGQRSQCVEFVSPAPRVIDEFGNEYLDTDQLEEGQIVVSPGLIYKKREWSNALHAEHLRALQTYVPKDIIVAEAPDADEGHIQLEDMDFTTDKVTQH